MPPPPDMSTTKRSAAELDGQEPVKRRKTNDNPQKIDVAQRAELLRSGKWSDFTITCQDQEFKVHRAIVVGHSEFFDKVLDGPFLETSTRQLDLAENDPLIVAVALGYIYTGEIVVARSQELLEDNVSFSNSEYEILVQTHSFADQILNLALKRHAFYMLVELLTEKYIQPIQYDLVSGESLRPLLKLVDFVFASTSGVSEVKQLLSWMLAYMNTSYPIQGIGDDRLARVAEENHELGIMMYRLLADADRQQTKCSGCDYEFQFALAERSILVDLGDRFRTIDCGCLWRGLCSPMCEIDNRAEYPIAAYCGKCTCKRDLPCGSEVVQNRARKPVNRKLFAYFENNKIKFKRPRFPLPPMKPIPPSSPEWEISDDEH